MCRSEKSMEPPERERRRVRGTRPCPPPLSSSPLGPTTPETPVPPGPWCLRGSGEVAPSAPRAGGAGSLPDGVIGVSELTGGTGSYLVPPEHPDRDYGEHRGEPEQDAHGGQRRGRAVAPGHHVLRADHQV